MQLRWFRLSQGRCRGTFEPVNQCSDTHQRHHPRQIKTGRQDRGFSLHSLLSSQHKAVGLKISLDMPEGMLGPGPCADCKSPGSLHTALQTAACRLPTLSARSCVPVWKSYTSPSSHNFDKFAAR